MWRILRWAEILRNCRSIFTFSYFSPEIIHIKVPRATEANTAAHGALAETLTTTLLPCSVRVKQILRPSGHWIFNNSGFHCSCSQTVLLHIRTVDQSTDQHWVRTRPPRSGDTVFTGNWVLAAAVQGWGFVSVGLTGWPWCCKAAALTATPLCVPVNTALSVVKHFPSVWMEMQM